MLEAGGRPRLVLKPLEAAGIQQPRKGEGLERHGAAERDLPGLVDDSHAAAADQPQNAEVAQCPLAQQGAVELGRRLRIGLCGGRQRPQPVDRVLHGPSCLADGEMGQFLHGRKIGIVRLVKGLEDRLAGGTRLHVLVEDLVPLAGQSSGDQLDELGLSGATQHVAAGDRVCRRFNRPRVPVIGPRLSLLSTKSPT
ncbi:MAG TPA: hypothetical protein VMR25_27920 [Planctomycetaceae bacterium]|nr:hypothetical protein [Planctomycetaceae bacterium]